MSQNLLKFKSNRICTKFLEPFYQALNGATLILLNQCSMYYFQFLKLPLQTSLSWKYCIPSNVFFYNLELWLQEANAWYSTCPQGWFEEFSIWRHKVLWRMKQRTSNFACFLLVKHCVMFHPVWRSPHMQWRVKE